MMSKKPKNFDAYVNTKLGQGLNKFILPVKKKYKQIVRRVKIFEYLVSARFQGLYVIYQLHSNLYEQPLLLDIHQIIHQHSSSYMYAHYVYIRLTLSVSHTQKYIRHKVQACVCVYCVHVSSPPLLKMTNTFFSGLQTNTSLQTTRK